MFKRATRTARKARIDLVGVSGSGKTWTALELATGLANGGKIAFIDTENSAEMYAEDFQFDVLNLTDYSVQSYQNAMAAASKAGYSVLVIDSLTHAWQHLLDEKENAVKRGAGNDYTAWAKITPIYKALLTSIVRCPMHIICTMRQKSDVVLEEYTDSNGRKRQRPVKRGLKAEFREGGEFEFDLVANIDIEHNLIVEKTRMKFLVDRVINKPTKALGEEIRAWLESAPAPTEPVVPEAPASPAPQGESHDLLLVNDLIANEKFDALGSWKIRTRCKMQGREVRDILTKESAWLDASLLSEETRGKFIPSDLKALVHFKQHMEGPVGE